MPKDFLGMYGNSLNNYGDGSTEFSLELYVNFLDKMILTSFFKSHLQGVPTWVDTIKKESKENKDLQSLIHAFIKEPYLQIGN